MTQPTHADRPAGELGGLVHAAQRGDALAMNDLLDLLDLLAPYVGRLCGPIALQDGPDAAQEALIAVFRAPFEQVWAVASDLEGELPNYLPDVRWLRVTAATGDRLQADARGWLGLRARFDGVLRPGWCVLQSRFLLGGIAAVPDGQGTKVAFLGSFRAPGMRLLRPLLAPLERRAGRMVLRRLETRVRQR